MFRTHSQVLTANIGTLMDLYGMEKGLEHYQSTQSLTFDQYIYYLQKEVRLRLMIEFAWANTNAIARRKKHLE